MEGRSQPRSSSAKPAVPKQLDTEECTTVSRDLAAYTVSRGDDETSESLSAHSRSQKHRVVQRKQRPICQFYMSSSCKFGNQCRFYHPKPSSKSLPKNSANKREKCDDKEKPTSSPDMYSSSRRAPSDINLGMYIESISKSRTPVTRPESVKSKTPADLLQVSTYSELNNSEVYQIRCQGFFQEGAFAPSWNHFVPSPPPWPF